MGERKEADDSRYGSSGLFFQRAVEARLGVEHEAVLEHYGFCSRPHRDQVIIKDLAIAR